MGEQPQARRRQTVTVRRRGREEDHEEESPERRRMRLELLELDDVDGSLGSSIFDSCLQENRVSHHQPTNYQHGAGYHHRVQDRHAIATPHRNLNACQNFGNDKMEMDIAEVFTPARVTKRARQRGLLRRLEHGRCTC